MKWGYAGTEVEADIRELFEEQVKMPEAVLLVQGRTGELPSCEEVKTSLWLVNDDGCYVPREQEAYVQPGSMPLKRWLATLATRVTSILCRRRYSSLTRNLVTPKSTVFTSNSFQAQYPDSVARRG